MEENKNLIKSQDKQVLPTQLVDDVKLIVERGLREAYDKVNTVAIHTYWLIGKRIVEEEQISGPQQISLDIIDDTINKVDNILDNININ